MFNDDRVIIVFCVLAVGVFVCIFVLCIFVIAELVGENLVFTMFVFGQKILIVDEQGEGKVVLILCIRCSTPAWPF